MNKVNVLFNSEKYYLESILPSLKDSISEVLFSSSNLLVYRANGLEIMINNVGNVTISTSLSDESDIKIIISSVFEEYNKLSTSYRDLFGSPNDFKIVSPKQHTPRFLEYLGKMNFITNVTDTIDSDTLSVH